jgi:hypothetical protein
MEHLREYIAGLNMAIAAGGDVRFFHKGKSVSAICEIIINEQDKCLNVTYITAASPYDQQTQIPASTQFTVEMDDRPDELREAGWK